MSERLRPGEHRPQVGERMAPVGLPDPSEAAATLLVFTSSGCPYALAWHDRIQDVARDYQSRGVQTVQIFSNDESTQPADSAAALEKRVAAGDFGSPVLRDGDQSLAVRFGATATPDVFVLDREGTIRYHGAPDANHDDPAEGAGFVRDALDDVLADEAVRRPTTSVAGCSIKWRVELLWCDGCPTHDDAYRLLEDTLTDLGRHDVTIGKVQVATRQDADERAFLGSPTFHVGGRDLFPANAPASLGCRVYQRPDGRISPLPDQDELAARLRDALARPWDLPGWTDFRSRRAGASR